MITEYRVVMQAAGVLPWEVQEVTREDADDPVDIIKALAVFGHRADAETYCESLRLTLRGA